jgi:hypothetical protein
MEYFEPKRGSGVVFAFRGTGADEPAHSFVLKALKPEARYRLHFQDHSSPDETVEGKRLLGSGIRLHLSAPNSSELVFLDEVSGK